jgi:hypothetical protein
VNAHNPDQHWPVEADHCPDTVLPRFSGKASGDGSIVLASGVVEGGTAELKLLSRGRRSLIRVVFGCVTDHFE